MPSEPTASLRSLIAFLEVVATGSTHAAAAQVPLTQSAISQSIARLEDRFGAQLFERHGGGMTPTQAGKALASRVQRAMQHLRAGEQALEAAGANKAALLRHATSSQLLAVIAVAAARSFTGAALRLGVSEPTIHRAARQLEHVVGLPLLRATPTGVEPTAHAIALARAASLAFEEIRQAEVEIREAEGAFDGCLRIGSLPLGRVRIVPDAVLALKSAHPRLTFEILDGAYAELVDHLRHGRLDVIFGALRARPEADIEQELLFEDPLSIIVRAGHPLAGRTRPSAPQLANLTWVVPRALTPARENFARFFERRGQASPASMIECSSSEATRALLLGSDYAALLSRLQVEEDLAAGRLAACGAPLWETSREIGLATRRSMRPTRSQVLLLDALRASARVKAPAP